MRIDLPLRDAWLTLSEEYRNALPFEAPQTIQVQAYYGYQHALLEITQGLSKLFSHKKTVAIASSLEPTFDSIAMWFAEEEYTVKVLSPAELADPTSWYAAVEGELLFVLYSEDDPVTGRRNDIQKLSETVQKSRVFNISLSHEAHRFQSLERPAPFGVRVLSLAHDRALLMAGERCRVQPTFAKTFAWDMADIRPKTETELKPHSVEQADKWERAIKSFEKNLPKGFKSYFEPDSVRIYDRAVIYHPEIDGSALIDKLGHLLGTQIVGAGRTAKLETTSPCRWESPRFQEWLKKRGESEEVIRGLICISADLVDPSLSEKLDRAAKEILALQRGE